MVFPNLPYMVDGDKKLSETYAIHEYLAEKYRPDLLGRNTVERGHCDMFAGVL